MIVNSEERWIPPLDFGRFKTDLYATDELYGEYNDFLYTYFKVVYHSSLVYSMVDITVRTQTELLLLSMLTIVSAIINAIIYG